MYNSSTVLTFRTNLKTKHRSGVECSNVLGNLTVGRWLVLPDVNGSDVKRLDQVFINYWKKRGIPVQRWREDGKCGYHKYSNLRLFIQSENKSSLIAFACASQTLKI